MKSKPSKKSAKSSKEVSLEKSKPSKKLVKSKLSKKPAKSSKKAGPRDTETIVVAVQVSYVGNGGNAGSGIYQYVCVPSTVHVTKTDTVISYQMTPQTGAEFTFIGLYTTDSLYEPQLSAPVIAPDGRSIEIVHANAVAVLINVALQVQDSSKQARVSCDPQVTNDPNPGW